MSKKALAVLSLGIAVVFLLSSAGCVSKKRLRTVEEQNAQQLAQANARIDELVQKNSALDQGLKLAQDKLAAARLWVEKQDTQRWLAGRKRTQG